MADRTAQSVQDSRQCLESRQQIVKRRAQSAESTWQSLGRSYSVKCRGEQVVLSEQTVDRKAQSIKRRVQRVPGRALVDHTVQSVECKKQQVVPREYRVDRRAQSAESSWQSLKSGSWIVEHRSVLTTSVKILPNRSPAQLIKAKYRLYLVT